MAIRYVEKLGGLWASQSGLGWRSILWNFQIAGDVLKPNVCIWGVRIIDMRQYSWLSLEHLAEVKDRGRPPSKVGGDLDVGQVKVLRWKEQSCMPWWGWGLPVPGLRDTRKGWKYCSEPGIILDNPVFKIYAYGLLSAGCACVSRWMSWGIRVGRILWQREIRCKGTVGMTENVQKLATIWLFRVQQILRGVVWGGR